MTPRENDQVRKVLLAHQTGLRSFASAFQSAVVHDNLPVTREMLETVATRMWQFGPLRIAMSEEMGALAKSFKTQQIPDDFALRIARLSLAMYFLEAIESMQTKTIAADSTALSSLFKSATDGLLRVLDSHYFSKTEQQIISDYLDAEPALVACATCCSVKLKPLSQAFHDYKMTVAAEIDAILTNP